MAYCMYSWILLDKYGGKRKEIKDIEYVGIWKQVIASEEPWNKNKNGSERIYKELMQLSTRKTKKLIFKMGKIPG